MVVYHCEACGLLLRLTNSLHVHTWYANTVRKLIESVRLICYRFEVATADSFGLVHSRHLSSSEKKISSHAILQAQISRALLWQKTLNNFDAVLMVQLRRGGSRQAERCGRAMKTTSGSVAALAFPL